GSILATPLLLYVVGISQPHIAIGTGALAVSVNAYANLIGHARKGHVWWRCAIVFAATGTVGALAGSSLGKAFDGQKLLFLFGLLMLAVGAMMLRPRTTVSSSTVKTDRLTCWKTAAVALGAGAASGFFGIGGGFLIVPGLMLSTGMPMISAVGSSLLAVGTFGLATAVTYALSGLIDWVIAAEFIGGGVIGGFGGMMLATRLAAKRNLLNQIFASLIIVVAFYVLYKNSIAVLPL
ncbi:MAG: sulfite exporter TauE/SafE family protein, partial [Rhizobium sp.]|nr:sulfite exporter TauE/SafE family protein [Rhizobium sp.]